MHEVSPSHAIDYLSNCSEYHRRFFTTGEFFEPNQAAIQEIFSILGIPWSEEKDILLQSVREKLISKGGNKQLFTHEQAEKIHPYLVAMGLFESFVPPDCYYPELLVPGGTADALDGRLPWIKRLKVGRVVVMAGDRPVDNPNEIAQAFSEEGMAIEQNGHMFGVLSETDIANQMLIRLGRVSLGGVGQNPQDRHLTLHYQQDGEDVERDVVIMHGKAADRGELGAQRPTTESTVLEYLDRHAPPRNGSIIPIVVAGAGVFTMRLVEEVQRIVWDQGRDDIVIIPAGAAPEENTFYEWARMALPEIGRLICRSPSLELPIESRQPLAS